MRTLLLSLLLFPKAIFSQNDNSDIQPKLVADQTFKLEGKSEFIYAFAEGDQVQLMVQELTGKAIKTVEFMHFPDHYVYRGYELDTTLQQNIVIEKTGVYLLRFQGKGLGKKVCRFTLHRIPANAETARLNTRVGWDMWSNPNYAVRKRAVQVGKKTDVVSLGGQVTVSASKFYTKKPTNVYQFTLPPNTVQWAYRISVGQATQEARRRDAEKLKTALQTGAVKLMSVQPQTALAAFALGAALDMTVSSAGEDVEYALVDYDNWSKFSSGKEYTSYIQQGSVSVDVQRRYKPLQGTYYFALKSDNWVNDINVSIDIEAVTEVPVFETEIYLEPISGGN
ncbi:MAG: hypothetical protein KF734_17600 [Saprospiraceae bacterium]|nr:hypothetical protein [Saprospiraceae bacterium]